MVAAPTLKCYRRIQGCLGFSVFDYRVDLFVFNPHALPRRSVLTPVGDTAYPLAEEVFRHRHQAPPASYFYRNVEGNTCARLDLISP